VKSHSVEGIKVTVATTSNIHYVLQTRTAVSTSKWNMM